jgi:hypothetical protein
MWDKENKAIASYPVIKLHFTSYCILFIMAY